MISQEPKAPSSSETGWERERERRGQRNGPPQTNVGPDSIDRSSQCTVGLSFIPRAIMAVWTLQDESEIMNGPEMTACCSVYYW